MAAYRNTSIGDDIRRQFSQGTMVTRLIMVNVGVFLAMSLINLILFFTTPNETVSTIAESMSLRQFRFEKVIGLLAIPIEPDQMLNRFWTPLTYMFLHVEFLHILFNMLFLFWFGRILHQFIGNRKILPIYFYGGLVGAATAIIVLNLSPQFRDLYFAKPMLGASAGVMAIVAGAATIAPNYTVFLLLIGAVRLKYIALVVILLDVLAIPTMSNAGGHLAHIGGALLGFIFIKQLQRGRDWSIGFNRLFEGLTNLFSRRRQPRVVYRSEKRKSVSSRKKKASRYEKGKQEYLDEILDKIAQSGYENLSQEEKEFLFRVSKEE